LQISREPNIPTQIHPTAIVSSKARLGTDVVVGPYSVIADDVEIGPGSRIGNFVTVDDGTTIGENCIILHNSSIGAPPQDLKYAGEKTRLLIGDNVIIRESCTLNRGTAARGATEIGAGCLLMAYVHIAHDCVIGERAIFANQATLGGHAKVGPSASLGGGVLMHQFCRVGRDAFIGGGFRIVQDVPPYILAAGNPLRYAGINRVGLERNGFKSAARTMIKRAYRIYFRSSLPRKTALEKIKAELPHTPEVEEIINFIESSARSII